MTVFLIQISILLCLLVIMAICLYYQQKESKRLEEAIADLKEKTKESDKTFEDVHDLIISRIEYLKTDLESDKK